MLTQLDRKRARRFFRRNTSEVIERMRNPTDPTNNLAAVVVADFALDPRLRNEARDIIEAQRTARQARGALDMALESYAPKAEGSGNGRDSTLPMLGDAIDPDT
jgi:hypothetical protein